MTVSQDHRYARMTPGQVSRRRDRLDAAFAKTVSRLTGPRRPLAVHFRDVARLARLKSMQARLASGQTHAFYETMRRPEWERRIA